ncbi:MAG: DUF3048 domain-containing protein [Mogibacterium sp.]|nr:DUF3048 domain-containing protein [Mogibacterium sp.]
MKKRTLRIIVALGLILLLGMSVFIITSCSGGSEEPEEVPEEAAVIMNPLTGATVEDGFDENAAGMRPAAFVVENTPDARPQWGLDDPNYSPDIVLQGEVEGGITRTLWFYADYTKLPEIIGPMRSARPPYIKFSELFDSIFIHWGQSSSKGEYIGANTVFKKDKVDHINQMKFDESFGLFGRDMTRTTSLEHRGILYGDKVPGAIESKKFRTEAKECTTLNFDPAAWLTSFTPAKELRVKYSDQSSTQTTYWTYNEEDQKYHTSSFANDFERDNLLVLFDQTEYITKYNYMNTGNSVVYCDYKLAGGKGMLFSKGVVKDIEWKVEDGKLILIDTELTKFAQEQAEARAAEAAESGEEDSDEAAEEEASEPIVVEASLNPGKTWIGWASSNNGGNVDIINE